MAWLRPPFRFPADGKPSAGAEGPANQESLRQNPEAGNNVGAKRHGEGSPPLKSPPAIANGSCAGKTLPLPQGSSSQGTSWSFYCFFNYQT